MDTIYTNQVNNTVYCEHCKVTPLRTGNVELCDGCIQEIVDWLMWDKYADELNKVYSFIAQDHTYHSQFTL
jgi:hypothetical protein